MTDREERQHVIEVLKSWDGYFIGYTSDEVQEALRYAIASIKTDLKYDLLYEETSGQVDKPTTKNDLGVDCISRADAIKAMQNKAKKLKNEDTINGLCGAVAILYEMPSVTPQELRKGYWKLVQRGKVVDICCSKCEAARIKGYAYNYTVDQLKEDLKEYLEKDDMRYCPNCGAKMVEPQESEE